MIESITQLVKMDSAGTREHGRKSRWAEEMRRQQDGELGGGICADLSPDRHATWNTGSCRWPATTMPGLPSFIPAARKAWLLSALRDYALVAIEAVSPHVHQYLNTRPAHLQTTSQSFHCRAIVTSPLNSASFLFD